MRTVMKKLLTHLLLMFIIAVGMISCTPSTPSGAMEKYLSSLKSGDYEGFVDGVNFSETDPAKLEESREMLTSLIKEKVGKEFEKQNGIKKFEIISETISEDGNSATVEYITYFGDGSDKKEKSKMIKVDGKWMMDMNK